MELSYGVVPLAFDESRRVYLFVVQHKAGHWSFPKGHVEIGETPKDTAQRELFEETHFEVVEWLPLDPIGEEYHLIKDGKERLKRVVYFYALVSRACKLPEPILQQSELISGRFVLPEEVEPLATFPEMKRLGLQVVKDLHKWQGELQSKCHE